MPVAQIPRRGAAAKHRAIILLRVHDEACILLRDEERIRIVLAIAACVFERRVSELEELRDGLRLYRVREQHREVVEGRRVLVIRRLTKRLVDGRWETVYEVEHVRPA